MAKSFTKWDASSGNGQNVNDQGVLGIAYRKDWLLVGIRGLCASSSKGRAVNGAEDIIKEFITLEFSDFRSNAIHL